MDLIPIISCGNAFSSFQDWQPESPSGTRKEKAAVWALMKHWRIQTKGFQMPHEKPCLQGKPENKNMEAESKKTGVSTTHRAPWYL